MKKYLITLFFDFDDEKSINERDYDRFILECEEGSFKSKMYEYFEINKYSWGNYAKAKNGYKMICSIESSCLTDLKVYK